MGAAARTNMSTSTNADANIITNRNTSTGAAAITSMNTTRAVAGITTGIRTETDAAAGMNTAGMPTAKSERC